MRASELHDEFVRAVLFAGAVAPTSLFPAGYQGENADAVFVDERALVEVKSVYRDHAAAVELESRLAPAFKRWEEERPSVIFGTVQEGWGDFPEWLQHEIDDAMAPSVARQLRKANSQFRATKDAIKWDCGYGIVAFIVPSGFNVDPWLIGRIAWNQLVRRGDDNLPEINAVLVVTVAVSDQPPSGEPLMFAPAPRRDEPIPHDLTRRIADAWFNHLATKSGKPVGAFEATADEFFQVPRRRIVLKFGR